MHAPPDGAAADRVYDLLREDVTVDPSYRQAVWQNLADFRCQQDGLLYTPRKLLEDRRLAHQQARQGMGMSYRCLPPGEGSMEWLPMNDDDIG